MQALVLLQQRCPSVRLSVCPSVRPSVTLVLYQNEQSLPIQEKRSMTFVRCCSAVYNTMIVYLLCTNAFHRFNMLFALI